MRIVNAFPVRSVWPLLFLLTLGPSPVFAAPQDTLPSVPVIADKLPEIPSGPGVGIADPVAKNADADTTAFGAGCSRWLLFALYENPELGQTPRWAAQDRVRKELGLSDLRLTTKQAAQFAKMAGYTHLAVGEITGHPENCTLSFQLYVMPGNTPVGPPLKATGSEAKVVAALPGLTRQMLGLLKVSAPHLPATPSMTAADLTLIGRYAWWVGGAVSAEDDKQMESLAEQQSLAGMILRLHTPMANMKTVDKAYSRMLAQSPGNLAIRMAMAGDWRFLSPEMRQALINGLPPNPTNYIVAICKWMSGHSAQEDVAGAERMVQCAPQDPGAWMTLARQYENVAEQFRRGRPAAMISEGEWRTLNKIYERWFAVTRRATELDPEYGLAWTELAVAGTFAGQEQEADAALWKAIRLDRGNSRPFTWGLQMYQPKWIGDADKLAKVAKLAVEDRSLSPDGDYDVYNALRQLNMASEAKILLDRTLEGYREQARRTPKDPETHRALGVLLNQLGKTDEAIAEFKEGLRADPDAGEVHYELGVAYEGTRQTPEAIQEFRETIRISPMAYNAIWRLGRCLIIQGKMDEAEAQFRKALAIRPDVAEALNGLGYILTMKKQYDEALKQYQLSARVKPETGEPYLRQCWIYMLKGDFDKAIQFGKLGVRFAPKYYLAYENLGLTYLNAQQYEEAEQTFRKEIEVAPKSGLAHAKLGKVLLKLGNKDEAKEELKKGIALEPDTPSGKEAQKLLNENP